MSTQEEQQMAETKPRIMTGFIHYGEQDDLETLFSTLNEFRKNNGLKYSHQSKASMVFFNISSEHLDAFSKVRPFKISRFQTRTEYKCSEKTSLQLMGQKDSFLRMLWDEQTETVSFQSRTPSRVHGNLVRRIFRDSGVEFERENYSVFRNTTSGSNQDTQDATQETTQDTTQEDTPEGFQRVEKKQRKTKSSTSSKVVKETKPKVRGTKVVKETKTTKTSKAPKTDA